MLKIAIVSDAIYPYNKGGKEKRIYEISTRLAKKGHHVTIYCMKWWEGSDTRIDDGVHIKAISPYFPLYSGERRSIKEAFFFSLYCLKLVKENFDIIDVDHMPHLVLFSTKLVALLKGKKLYVIWNEVWGASYWIKYMGPLGVLAALIEKISSMLPDKITAVSDYTVRALTTKLKVSPHKITVVPNGISVAEFEDIAPAALHSDVIFVGRLLSHKNIDVLIQSIALLKTKYPKIKCIIVGRGPESSNLIRLVQKNDLLENIEFIEGIEDHKQLYSLMKSSRIFAFPSTREGFGIVVLEANGCGLPVITTDHHQNAARYLIREGLNGKTISLSKENLAKAIDIYMTMKPDSTRYISFLKEYDWDNLAQRVEDVYTTSFLSKMASQVSLPSPETYVEVQKEMGERSRNIARKNYSWEKFNAKLLDIYYKKAQSTPMREPKMIYVTTSWDDGHRLDSRLAELLKKYEIKGTFYICPQDREFKHKDLLSAQGIVSISKDFEIGGHTITHPHLTKITLSQADDEIAQSKAYLEDLLQKDVTAFCYPYGDYNDEVEGLVKKHGYKLARTTKRYAFDLTEDVFALPTTFHTYTHYSDLHKIIFYTNFSLTTVKKYWNWEKLAIALFDRTCQTGGVFHLWGHSWEIEKYNGWQKLENVLSHIAKKDTVIHQTNTESLR